MSRRQARSLYACAVATIITIILMLIFALSPSIKTSVAILQEWVRPDVSPEPLDSNLELLQRYSQRATLVKYGSGCPTDRPDALLVTAADLAYISMFRNFHKTAVQFHGLQTCFKVYCFDAESAGILRQEFDIDCTCISLNTTSNEPAIGVCNVPTTQNTDFASGNFNIKSNLKTAAILNELAHGRSVLFSDVDIIFLQNPFVGLLERDDCPKSADICFMEENGVNTGFLFTQNRQKSLELYKLFLQRSLSGMQTANDQIIFNSFYYSLVASGSFQCELKLLPSTAYAIGLHPDATDHYKQFYWQTNWTAVFDRATVVHFNNIVGRYLKHYVMREMLMWFDDADGYYSSPTRNYLLPDICVSTDRAVLRDALHLAVSTALFLNRTLILPRFVCPKKPIDECNFSHYFTNSALFYAGKVVDFRENTFLVHPYVPTAVKRSRSPLFSFAGFNDQLAALAHSPYRILRVDNFCNVRFFVD